MPFCFCPQCGTPLQPAFRFCPSCGDKLPAEDQSASPGVCPPPKDVVETSTVKTRRVSNTSTHEFIDAIVISQRPALRRTRNSGNKVVRFDTADVALPATPAADHRVTEDAVEPPVGLSPSTRMKSPQSVKGKAKAPRAAGRLLEEEKKLTEGTAEKPAAITSPVSTLISRSPLKGRSRAKKAKSAPAVEPLQDGEELTDTTGKKWRLVKLLGQTTTELTYEVSPSNSKASNHILKLGAKDGRIFTEQNFLQRAAKPSSVDKWMKQNKMDFLGIPSCVGFGLHTESYRFLILPNMGQSLHTALAEEGSLSMMAVLQLAHRIVDVLHYIHSNEYVHADLNAENIYITPGPQSQVYLGGYCHAFRYCPSGRHVEYREASRTPHEGSLDFISLDVHRGAPPSRRSDLQSLAYCLLHWHTGTLPWSVVSEPQQVAAQKQRYLDDVPALLSHCFGNNKVPSVFQTFLSTAMTLQYTEEPNYSELKYSLSDTLLQLGGAPGGPFSFS